MEYSELNHHLVTMSIIDNHLSTCGSNETTNYFFIECPQQNRFNGKSNPDKYKLQLKAA